jgi:hypothetical protein
MTLSTTMLCYYAECRILFTIMLNVVMLSVVMLCVVAPFGVHSHNLSRADPVYESVYFTYDIVIVSVFYSNCLELKL